MSIKIAESWKKQLESEFEKEYFKSLTGFVKEDIENNIVYPPEKLIFNAFDKCSFENTKVVIIGQDPYHGKGQANGLSFSVNDEVRIPPSLKNIFKEINTDLGQEIPKSGNLERWAEQGVLLLNSILTVRSATPGSHQKKGWETFTDAVIETVSSQKEKVVFMLWGKYAQQKGAVIDKEKHLVLESAHPSPFAAHKGFFGNQHFSKANDYLKSIGKEEIEW
jgi:uracil-DNA glycosylase